MDLHRQFWNEFYTVTNELGIDNWLEAYKYIFESVVIKPINVIDIGCGNGSSIPFLKSMDTTISACDYSSKAMDTVKNKFKIENAERVLARGEDE
jgi:2-polyprenyl-3-methyl-5-hydroxy-6-metoxy-1,4-benzoquinol methylase